MISKVAFCDDETGGATVTIDASGYPHIIAENEAIPTPRFLELYWDGSAWQSVGLSVGATGSSPPMVYRLGSEMYYVTTAYGRVRVVHKTSNKAFCIGGVVENGVRLVPEPIGARDASRLTFLIPEGDQPAIYELAPKYRLV